MPEHLSARRKKGFEQKPLVKSEADRYLFALRQSVVIITAKKY